MFSFHLFYFKANRAKRTSNTNVDKLFQEFVEQQHGKKTAGGDGLYGESATGGKLPSVAAAAAASAAASRKARKSSRSSSRGGTRKRLEASGQQITEEERREFQEYLGLLQPYHHLMVSQAMIVIL